MAKSADGKSTGMLEVVDGFEKFYFGE